MFEQDRKPEWFFVVRQSEVLVEIEIRPTRDQTTGCISALKRLTFEPYGVGEAEVRVGFQVGTLALDKAWQLAEWLQTATILAHQLDNYIKTPADFKERFEAVQYAPGGFCYVSPVKEPATYQQRQGPEWVSGEREE